MTDSTWSQDQVENLLAERDGYKRALQDVEPLVAQLAKMGWIKGAEAALIIRSALS